MSLTFDELRMQNVARCESAFHPLHDWSLSDWSNAMAGEAGEACNLTKKWRRGEPISGEELGRELADVVIYADLCAAAAGIDLGEWVARKFNEVSQRTGAPHQLPVMLRGMKHLTLEHRR